ncbi:hypothetical protein ONZ45_g13092 [Pleurotus djamor]|nr:hypothetical protein ONZ45_g13092 [Pleurotus djamor]
MGRKQLHQTEEEKANACREKHRRYYERHRELILATGRAKYMATQQEARQKKKGTSYIRPTRVGRTPAVTASTSSTISPSLLAYKKISALATTLELNCELQYDDLCVQSICQGSEVAIEAKLEAVNLWCDSATAELNIILQHEGASELWKEAEPRLVSFVATMTSQHIALDLSKEEVQHLKTYWVLHYREAIIKGRVPEFFEQFWPQWFGRFPIEVSPIEHKSIIATRRQARKKSVKATLKWLRLSYWPAHAPRDAPIIISDDEDEGAGGQSEPIVISDDDDEDDLE